MSNQLINTLRNARNFKKKVGQAIKVVAAPKATPKVEDPTLQTWIKEVSTQLKTVATHTVTRSDLVNAGIANIVNGELQNTIKPSEEVNTTVPAAVMNLAANGAVSSITLDWVTKTSSLFGENVIYRSEVDDFGLATQIGSTLGDVYTDYVGNNIKAYYWVRTVSKYGVEGELSPSVFAQTSIDVEYVLGQIEGQINSSHLDQILNSKIVDIDKIKSDLIQEAETRANAIIQSANDQLSALNAMADQIRADANNTVLEINTKVDEVRLEAQTKIDLLKASTLLDMNALDEKIKAEMDGLNDGLTQEIQFRIDGDTANSTALTAYKTSNDNAVAVVLSKAETAIADGKVNATNIQAVEARTTTNESNIAKKANATAVTALESKVDSNNTAMSSRVDKLAASITDLGEGAETNVDVYAFNALKAEVESTQDTVTGHTSDISNLKSSMVNAEHDVAANAEAISATNTTVTQQGQSISAASDAIQQLQTDVSVVENGLTKKADATALNNYYTKTQADTATAGKIESYDASLVIGGSNLINRHDELKNHIVNLSGAVTVLSDNSTINGYIEVIAGEPLVLSKKGAGSDNYFRYAFYDNDDKVILRQANNSNLVKLTVPTGATRFRVSYPTNVVVQAERGTKATSFAPSEADVQAQIDANATAITNTNTEVGRVNGVVTAQGTSISKLQSDLTAVDTKAGTAVTNAANAQSTANTAVTKADAAAASLVTLNAKFDLSALAAENLLINSNVVKAYDGGYPHHSYSMTEPWEVGETYTLLWCAEHQRNGADTNSYITAYAGGGTHYVSEIAQSNGKAVRKTTFVKTSSGTSPVINFYVINKPAVSTGTVATVYWAVLVKGNVITTDRWIPSSKDYTAELKATNAEITSFKKAYADADAALTTQIEKVNSDLTTELGKKADASILTNYYTKASSDEATAGKLEEFNSNLKIGGDNQVKNGAFKTGTLSRWGAWGAAASAERTVEKIGNKYFAHLVGKDNTQFKGLSQGGLPFEPGKKYIISLVAYSTAENQKVSFLIHQVGSNNDPQIYIQTPILTATPTKYELTFTSTSAEKSHFNLMVSGLNGAAYDIYLTDIMFQIGTKSTEWQPSSYDQDYALSTAMSTVYTKSETDTVIAGELNSYNAGLVIGGVNLLKNSDFSDGTTHWQNSSGGALTVESDSLGKFNKIAKVVSANASQGIKVSDTNAIVLDAQTTYTFSGWVRSDTATTLYASLDGSGNTYAKAIPSTTAWTYFEYTRKVVDNRIPRIYGNSTYYVANLQVEKGVKATDWSPSSSDIQNQLNANATAISTTNAEVSRINGVVVAQGTSITNLQADLTAANNNIGLKADGSALNTLTTRVTNAEGELASQSNQLTALSASLQAQGANLLKDGGFETLKSTSGTTIAFTQEKHSGTQCLKFTRTSPTGSGGNNDVYLGEFFDVSGGRTYYIEAYVRSDPTQVITPVAGSYFRLGINVLKNITGAYNWLSIENIAIATLSNEWKKVSGFITCPTGYDKGRLWLAMPASTTINLQNTSLLIDSVFVTDATEGYVASEAAKANATAISTTNAEVSRINGVVVAQGTSITNLQADLTIANNNIGLKADGSALNTLTTRVTNAEGELASQSNQSTLLTSRLNNFKAAGRNYLLNSKTVGSKSISTDINTVLEPLANIKMSFDIDITTAVQAGVKNRIGFECSISLNGKNYWFGVWLNNAASVGIKRMRVYNTAYIPSDWVAGVSTFPTTFTYYNQTSGGAFTISNVQLEVGDAYTDWGPAPEDEPDMSQYATATALSTLTTRVTNAENVNTSQATSLNALSTSVGENKSAIAETSTSINGVKAIKTVTIDNNGVISGYGLISEIVNGKVTSSFGVNADTFYIGSPSSGKKPFVVLTSSGVINGVTVPAGTYIDSAYIANGTITNAKIGNLGADKITTGDIAADRMKANIVQAMEGKFTTLSSIVATLGTIISWENPTTKTGARTVMSDNGIYVYDANGVLRVRLGRW